MQRFRDLNSFGAYLVLSILALLLISGLCYFSGRTFIREGPAWHMYLTTQDIWEYGTIASDRFAKLARELQEKSTRENTTYWQDVFSVTANGQFYPKHCYLLSLLAAPFFGLMGKFGIWLFSQLLILCILLSLFRLSSRLRTPCPGLFLIISAFMGCELMNFVYQFDPDVLSAALVICGLDLSFRFPLFGSFILGLSIFTRPLFLFLAPVLLSAPISYQYSKIRTLDILIGCGTAFSFNLASNYILWGSPLTFPHHRFPLFVSGQIVFDPWPVRFDLPTLFSNWGEKLFDPHIGLLVTNPILLLLPFALPFLYRTPGARNTSLAMLSFAIIQALLIYSYSGWAVTPSGGNRYLLPAILLLSTIVVAALGPIWIKLTKGS